jgi:signal transduction histidine kinase
MKPKGSTISKVLSSSICDKIKSLFFQPMKRVVIDLGIYFLINFVTVYCLLFLATDSTVAMTGTIWVGIIAWRCGVPAGLLGCIVIIFSSAIAMSPPFHRNILMVYYFNNRVPSSFIGLSQSLIVAAVVGYISTLFHRLREEISLRKKTQRDLEQKISELDAFGHTVAHDLKNPLMVINASTDMLVKEFELSGNVKTKKMLAFINDGTNHMVNIIESILMLAGVKKIDRKEFVVFSISESVSEALKRMKYNIESNSVQVSKPDSWPSVFGYAPWITDVWVNYINNAIKYGGNPALQIKPIVELGYDKPEKSEQIRFWVKDNGEGISKDKAGTLFKEFTRLHTGDKEGHGLGLSIVKTVIDKFNGVVGVESESGNGSLFYFTLPVKNPQNN